MRNMFALVLALALVATMGFATGETEEAGAASGAPVRSGQYGEAPMLAALVASGELPPIEERLPETPRVLEVEEIGTYGGTLQQVRSLDESDWLAWVMTKEPLTIVSPDLLSTLPNVAREFSVSEDGTTITFTLRPGMRWSDGAAVRGRRHHVLVRGPDQQQGADSGADQLLHPEQRAAGRHQGG